MGSSRQLLPKKVLGQRPRRWSLTFAFVLVSLVGISVACGDSKNGISGSDKFNPGQVSCGTPQMGCPCDTPGAKVVCGKKISGANNFLYCFEGVRTCLPTGLYGDCEEGSIHSKDLSTIQIKALATTGGPCQGVSTNPLLVCTNGRRAGEPCTVNGDCGPGIRRCFGGTDSTQGCRDDGDCEVTCERFNGRCSGGPTPDIGCMVDADCGAGGTCPAAGGGNNCGTYTGVCDSPGPEDGDTCNADAECPGGNCRPGHGVCVGGKRNGKHCHKAKHCSKGGGYCTSDIQPDAATQQLIDPCDPYCQVYSDTPEGYDAGPGFLNDGAGITPTPGCGNGALNGSEQCDDGNLVNGDGCTSGCMLEVGYQCPTPGSPCIPSTCGNGIVEGLEQCDDGNGRPYDGCSPTCTREVTCPPTGPCTAVCGDGIKFPSEACDDGNLTDGDGCSSTCTVEPGATCNTVVAPSPAFIDVPVIYRDFDGNTHPDFQKFGTNILPHNVPPAAPWYYSGTINCPGGTVTGIPAINLGADKEPVLNATQDCTASAAHFFQWYHDDPTVNQVILGRSLRLFNIGGGAYRFNSGTDTVTTANINCGDGTGTHCQNQGGFWPIDGLGFGDWAATGKNFHFTSEVRYPFTYAGGETLNFSGDDDVFVYVNGMKVVDLGGVHPAVAGSVTLNAATVTAPAPGVPVPLTVGETYEIVVFQAERNTTGSNYILTLQGFNQTKSVCSVPAPPVTITRDFQAQCPPGNKIVWSLFRWQASVPVGASIDFKAATNDDPLLLPTTATDPTTVAIGSATNANSPLPPATPVWAYDPASVDSRLQAGTPPSPSKQWLRVFMTFNGLPVLYQWQQLFDCVPAE